MPIAWPVMPAGGVGGEEGDEGGAVLGGAEALALAQEAGQRLTALPMAST